MKKFMLILSITTLLVACGEDKTETPPTAELVSQPQILSYVPANTPLLMTSGLNPDQYPSRYTEVMQTNMEGAIKYLKVVMNKAMNEGHSSDEPLTDENGEVVESTPSKKELMKQKAKAFVDKWVFEDEFAKLGMKMGETQVAIYMVDLFPVLRIKLSADNQIEAMLEDFQTQFEAPFVTSEINNSKVRELKADELTVLIATDDDYLVISGAPTVIKDQMIGQLIGSTKPNKSMAQDPSVLQQVKQAHGYTIDDVMLIDIQQIADYFIHPAKHNSALVSFLQIEDNMLSADCKSEISNMFAKAPRLVAGSKVMNNDTIHASFVWEMDSTLSNDLASMTGRIPHGNLEAAMAFGMSFDIVSAKALAAKYVDEMVAAPYKCELFAAMNQQTTDLQAKLSQPIPPFVGNFKGFNFSLDDLKLNLTNANLANPDPKEMIESFKTQIYLAVDETEALLGMAQMMVPQLQGMEIKTDGSLITLADQVPLISGKDIPIDIASLYAAVSDNTIGFSMGHEGGGSLSEKVSEPGQNVLMSFSANVDGYKNLMEQIFSMAEMPDMPVYLKEELEMQKELTLDMLYWKSQVVTLAFTDQGFTTDINIKY
ncbi:MAG: hypothetical protein ACSHWU_01390 [Marinicella sp.]